MSHNSFTSEEDFAEAYDRYADAVFHHCYLRVFHREKAKELMMEAFTHLWRFIADGNYVDSMPILLYRVTNQIIEREQGHLPAPEEITERDQRLRVLRQIPADDRRILILHYVDGFSLDDIGDILEGAPGEHAKMLHHAESVLSSLLSHA